MAAAVLLFGAVMLSAQNLPDVQVENMSGEQVRIRDVVAGKPAIISFWGVTCKPCITELNTLNALMDEWLEQVDFDIIAVSVDDTRFLARAKSMVQKRAMNVSLTPQTFIVDAGGKIVYSHSGYTPGSEQELLDKLIEISGD